MGVSLGLILAASLDIDLSTAHVALFALVHLRVRLSLVLEARVPACSPSCQRLSLHLSTSLPPLHTIFHPVET